MDIPDSRQETNEHILRVRELLCIIQNKLEARGFMHDQSKLIPPEKPIIDSMIGRLKTLTYGSPEYKDALKDLGPALAHHYEHNTHHPEHYQKQVCIICFTEYPSTHKENCPKCHNGTMTVEPHVAGMSLLDVIEMLCDWKAAGERGANGSIEKSLKVNRERFKISEQLHSILENTVRELGWSN